MDELLTALGAMIVTVWIASEGLGQITKVRKDLIALVLGPTVAVIAQWVGWINAGEGLKGVVVALVMGLIATGTAALAHDKIVKPLTSNTPARKV